MIKNYKVLEKCPLFSGISGVKIQKLLECLAAKQNFFAKNGYIFTAGEKTDALGVILNGAALIINDDFWGKRQIVARIEKGGLFGEAFACAGTEELPVSVMAAEDSEVLFIKCRRIITPCSAACPFHIDLNRNLTLLLAGKNMALIQKMEYLTKPNTREKLLAYFSEQARLAGSGSFEIPFNREELADYLSVERSAMSAELSRMKDDGLIHYKKNYFELRRIVVTGSGDSSHI